MRDPSRRFVSDRGGNFAIVSALLALPLVLGVGLSLDYSTILRTRSDLQNTLDLAVLAIAREGKDVSDDRAREVATLFVAENYRHPVTGLKITHVGTAFGVAGVTAAPISFGNLFGYDGWQVAAASTADIAYASYEVGLVLDTTGSMAGGKLAAMKDAVNDMIDGMSTQVKDKDKLKFALIPFAAFVNVGPGFGPAFDDKGKQVAGSGADWLDLEGNAQFPQSELSDGASRFQVYANVGQTWPGCVETRYADGKDYDVSDEPPVASKPETLFVPAFAIDEPDTGYNNSYIASDAKPNDKTVTQKKKRWAKYGVNTNSAGLPLLGGLLDPVLSLVGLSNSGPGNNNGRKTIAIDTSLSKTGQPKGPGMGCDTQPIVPLSNDYATLKAKVDALKASGNTNITEGVAWGMRVLSPGEPFDQGSDKKKAGVQKVMVVLTDGSNVFGNAANELGSNYSSNGYLIDDRLGISSGGSSATNERMNERTLAACTNAKAAGEEVYTIRLEEPDVKTGDMLEKCATDADHYFDVPSRSKLDEAFAKIKEQIVKVRISS